MVTIREDWPFPQPFHTQGPKDLTSKASIHWMVQLFNYTRKIHGGWISQPKIAMENPPFTSIYIHLLFMHDFQAINFIKPPFFWGIFQASHVGYPGPGSFRMVVRNTFVEVEEHSEEEQVRSCFSHRLNRVEHGTASGRLGACTCTIFTYLSIIYTYIYIHIYKHIFLHLEVVFFSMSRNPVRFLGPV